LLEAVVWVLYHVYRGSLGRQSRNVGEDL